GMLSVLVAMFLFTSIHAFLKGCTQSYSPIQIVFFRNFFALIPLALFTYKEGGWKRLKTNNLVTLGIRGGVGVISLSALFQSILLLPFAEATVLMFTATFFVTLLSGPFLKEKVVFSRWIAVIVGFIGVVIMTNPTLKPHSLIGIGLGVLSAFLEAVLILQGRLLLIQSETTESLVVYYTLAACFITSVLLPFVWKTPTQGDFIRLVILGVGGGIGYYFVTLAYRFVETSVIAPLFYSAMVWGVLDGMIFFGEYPTFPSILGSSFIILSGFYLFLKERQQHQNEEEKLVHQTPENSRYTKNSP
ncbi:MAG: DMT family transporter, partial [Proteobacteria bacterium]|nr:DMT family transporter [Pseudomonadota bacterium]